MNLSSKGWGEEKKGMLGGLLGNKARAVEKSTDGVLVQLNARAIEMLWGAAEEFRLAKQRALVRARMELVSEAFKDGLSPAKLGSTALLGAESDANLSIESRPNHNLDLKGIEAVDEVLKGVPNHLIPLSLGEEIRGERKRSMLLQQQQMQSLQHSQSQDTDDEDDFEDAEEGVITPPSTQMFLKKSSEVLKTPPTTKSTTNPLSPPSSGWWGKVRTVFLSNKDGDNIQGNGPDGSPSVSQNPFLQPPMRSTPPPTPTCPDTPKEQKAAFHGIVSFSLKLPGLRVELSPSAISTTLRRTVQLVVTDVLVVAWFRRCPESWLPDIIDKDSKIVSLYYFVSLSISDAVAWERGAGTNSLPVLINVDIGEESPKALVARLERSNLKSRGNSTSINCKLVPVSIVLDYDLVRRVHRFFMPPTAPISWSVSPNKIGNLIKKEREIQEKKFGGMKSAEGSSPAGRESPILDLPAVNLISMDLDVGRLKVILPMDREIPRCPALKIELQTNAKHQSPADQRSRLEELRRRSVNNHTFTFSVTALSVSMGTPVQVKLDQSLKSLSKSSFAFEKEEVRTRDSLGE